MRKTRFVISGFGNVGRQIARHVVDDPSGRLEIAAVAARDRNKARAAAADLGLDLPVIAAAEAPDHAPVIVEAGTYESFRDIVEPGLRAGAHVIAVSVGALAVNLDLIDLAAEMGGTLQIANGTLPGLDILRSAREAGIEEVQLVSSILPRSLVQEAYIRDQGIDLARAETAAMPIFKGTAREAAAHFPRHFNVAVSLSLAGVGLDRTLVDISADGRLPGARHTIHVKSPAVTLEMTSHNLPSPENNRTSRIVAPSVLAALRALSAPLRVGS
jgi:aspartate dehydrogenase